MNFDPQKFFIGLMDFFSILLPGAVLACLEMDVAWPQIIFEAKYRALADGERLAMFLLASYVVGHLVFLLGPSLGEIYGCARHYSCNLVRSFACEKRI